MSALESSPARLLAPRYWPKWVALFLLRAIAHLPYRGQLALGAGLGRLLYLTSPKHRRIARANIGACFPELSKGDARRLLRRHFRSLGVSVCELGLSWWGSESQLRPLLHCEGMEHVTEALAKGNGVLLLTAHLTTWEISARLMSLLHPIDVTYRAGDDDPLGMQLSLQREKLYEAAIPKDGARQVVRRLKQNKIIWYAPDQGFGGRGRVYAPFFGIPAATNPATSRFAAITGASIVPYFARRRDDGSGYDLIIFPALEEFPGDDLVDDAARVNAAIERMIRLAPEQYLWVHKRFKKPPPGQPALY